MLYTDDYDEESQTASVTSVSTTDQKQDEKITELQTAVLNLSNEISTLQTDINSISSKIDDKYAAQTQTLSQQVTTAINTLQNELANTTTSALVIATDLQAQNAKVSDILTVQGSVSTPSGTVDDLTSTSIKADTIEAIKSMQTPLITATNAVVNYLNVVSAVIQTLNMTNLTADNIYSKIATIDKLNTSLASITRLNADIITVADNGDWHEPTAAPVNDELLKIYVPAYDGITNIVSENDTRNISILNNTLVTFDEKEQDLFRVEFDEYGTYLYFTDSFNYKEIHIGADSYTGSDSEIVDKTAYKQNITSVKGTVSATEITYGDGAGVKVEVVDVLPAEGDVNTIYIVRNDKSYFWNDDDYAPMSLDIDILSGHITSGEINENLIYPAIQYVVDGSDEAFSGTFYEITDFMTSDQIPEGAKLMYVENGTIKFCSTYAPYSGTKYGTTAQVDANKSWFESIEWIELQVDKELLVAAASMDLSTSNPAGWYDTYHKAWSQQLTFDYFTPASFEVEWDIYGEHHTYSSDGAFNINIKVPSTSANVYELAIFCNSNKTKWIVQSCAYNATSYPPITNLVVYKSAGTETVKIPLSTFEYNTPAITISDESEHSASVATQPVQAYVDYKQNAINDQLDIRSAQNALNIAANAANIAINTANIATNASNLSTEITRAKNAESANANNITAIINSEGAANGIATLDQNGRLPASQLPSSAITVVGYLDAANNHTLPAATDYDPGSEIVMISDGYYNASTAFSLAAGKTLTELEVTQANTLIAAGYTFTLMSGSTTLGTVKTFATTGVTLSDDTVISLPYTSELSATSVPDTVQITVLTGDVVIQIDGHWIHMENNSSVDSVNGKTGAVTLSASDVGALPVNNPVATGYFRLGQKSDTSYDTGCFACGVNIGSLAYGASATGEETVATGVDSHAEGYQSTSSDDCAHAEGWGTSAHGTATHAEGYYTGAGGLYAHAEGWGTSGAGEASHAEGKGTIASGKCQHVAGKLNIVDDTSARITGWGTEPTDTTGTVRKNIEQLGQDGTLRLAGDVYVDCENDSSGGSKLISTGNIKTVNGVSLVGSGNITLADLGISIV